MRKQTDAQTPENAFSSKVTFTAGCTYQNKLKQSSLVHFQELLVPNRNVVRSFLLVFIVLGGWRVVFVMGAPLNDLWGTNTCSIKRQVKAHQGFSHSYARAEVGKLFD